MHIPNTDAVDSGKELVSYLTLDLMLWNTSLPLCQNIFPYKNAKTSSAKRDLPLLYNTSCYVTGDVAALTPGTVTFVNLPSKP